MSTLNIADLDFDSIKNNFKNYLRSQDKFKDYNFDGSSMSIFLDILTYNTFYNAFYTNTIANEMFLDSASDRSAAVSRAKALGYTPDSATSSSVYVNIESHISKVQGETTPTSNTSISLLPYAEFSTSVQGTDYNFITTTPVSLYYKGDGNTHWIYAANNVKLSEGTRLTYYWKVQNENDKYIIPNAGVDTSSLTVTVRESEVSTSNTIFTKADNIVGVDSDDAVYWIYEGAEEKFYLEFGNGTIGKALSIGNILEISYIVCKGEAANGARSFSVGNYQYANAEIQETSSITVTNSSYSYLLLSNVNSSFSSQDYIRGLTSNATAYVYSFDSNNHILKAYSANGTFTFGETVRAEYTLGANTLYGANGIISSITTETSMSTGGSDIEPIESIKLYAPKTYSAQNRLVTSSDYEGVLRNEYPFLDAVVAWGGEEETPQKLGSVFLSMKPSSKETLDTWEKEHILNNIIEPRKMIGMNVNIIDPDYIYIQPTIEIKYNADLSVTSTQESIIDDVRNSITDFCVKNCNQFKNSFYYTPFCAMVDSSNDYILGNNTDIALVKHFKPTLNSAYTANNYATLNYNNSIYPYSSNGVSYIITSSEFTANVSSVTRPGCTMSISTSNNSILTVSNSTAVVISNAGTIDYANGIIYVSNLNVITTATTDTSNTHIIKVYANPKYNDLTSSKQQILKIYTTYNITATPIRSNK